MKGWATHFQTLAIYPIRRRGLQRDLQVRSRRQVRGDPQQPAREATNHQPGRSSRCDQITQSPQSSRPRWHRNQTPQKRWPSASGTPQQYLQCHTIATNHIPEPLLHGHFIPIPKGQDKDPRNPSNYRGISLLSTIGKTFEKVLLTHIQPEVKLNPLQGGFKKGFSCLHTAFVLQEAIQHTREAGKKAYMALLDTKKAFDTVWHKGLIVKALQKNLPKDPIRSVSHSGLPHISERCTAGRSSFFALNAVGSRFGCLHPITSHKLYSSLCLPILLYGSELWTLTKTELNLLERTHRKILRTIQGLPLTSLMGSRSPHS